jgi:hypothetical protein
MSTMEPDEGTQPDDQQAEGPRWDKVEAADATQGPRWDGADLDSADSDGADSEDPDSGADS